MARAVRGARVERLVCEILGALALGSVVGYGGSLLLRTVDDYLLEITATFVAAYGAFLLAERFHFSPVIAVVIAGLFFGNYGTATAMSERTNAAVSLTWEFAGFVANSLIFLLIGLALEIEALAGAWWVVLVAFASSLAGRALSVYTLSPLLRGGMAIPVGFRCWGGWGWPAGTRGRRRRRPRRRTSTGRSESRRLARDRASRTRGPGSGSVDRYRRSTHTVAGADAAVMLGCGSGADCADDACREGSASGSRIPHRDRLLTRSVSPPRLVIPGFAGLVGSATLAPDRSLPAPESRPEDPVAVG